MSDSMRITSTTDWAVLALLGAQPSQGDEVARRLRGVVENAEALGAWLTGELEEAASPDELQRQIEATLAGTAGDEQLSAVGELLDRYELACVEEASRLPLRPTATAAADSQEALLEGLVLAARRATLDARRQWLVHARSEVRACVAGQGEAP